MHQANLVVQEARLGVAMADLNAAQAILDEKEGELRAVQVPILVITNMLSTFPLPV